LHRNSTESDYFEVINVMLQFRIVMILAIGGLIKKISGARPAPPRRLRLSPKQKSCLYATA